MDALVLEQKAREKVYKDDPESPVTSEALAAQKELGVVLCPWCFIRLAGGTPGDRRQQLCDACLDKVFARPTDEDHQSYFWCKNCQEVSWYPKDGYEPVCGCS